jgi:hypothetical protein
MAITYQTMKVLKEAVDRVWAEYVDLGVKVAQGQASAEELRAKRILLEESRLVYAEGGKLKDMGGGGH